MSRRAVALIVALALARAGAPARALAQEPAPPAAYDTVVLRDGTVLRGTILELKPGREIIISVAGGPRTVPWQEVASSSVVGVGDSTKGQVPSDSYTEAEPTPGPSRPRLFIELTRPTELHLLEGGVMATTTTVGARTSRAAFYTSARSVCRAPCGKVIDGSAGYPFFFGGDRLLPSRPFFLKDLEGDYVARVRPGRVGLLTGGVVLGGFGYAGTLTGGLLVGLGGDSQLRPIGGVVLGVGLALLAAGITMAAHGVTRYKLRRR